MYIFRCGTKGLRKINNIYLICWPRATKILCTHYKGYKEEAKEDYVKMPSNSTSQLSELELMLSSEQRFYGVSVIVSWDTFAVNITLNLQV